MKWLGLTGGLGTGKSTVAALLREAGHPVIDADVLSRDAVAKGSDGLAQVVEVFGEKILNNSGELDRPALGREVFGQPDKLAKLEQIIHPIVRDLQLAKRRELESQDLDLAFYDIPLLFEKKLSEHFDGVVVVACSPEQQRQRLKERNSWSEEEISQRLSHQVPIDEKVKAADWVIDNSGSLADLKTKVLNFLDEL